MALDLDKYVIYADPYRTNWHYLDNMTSLQVKALEEMEWDGEYKEINASLWYVPRAWVDKKRTEDSVEDFIIELNNKINGL